MTGRTSPQRGGLVIGLALILLGAAALLAQVGGLSIGWPSWIIVPGLALVLGAVAVGGPGGSGMAAVGGIVTMVGVVLAVQEAAGLYQTWAYAWALVAPGGVGAGLAVYGLLARRGEDLRGGLGALFVGVVLFLVGFLFFEGVIGLSGERFGNLTEVAVPLALVGIGVVVLVGAFIPGPWRRPYVIIHDTQDRSAAERGDDGPGWAASVPDRLAIPLEGAGDAEVMVTFGAGHLQIAAAAAGMLVDGTFVGGVRVERGGGPGRARLVPPAPPSGWALNRAPYTWTMGVSAEVPLRLRVETGAADADLDLGGLRLTELRLRTGASETRIGLPAAAGFTRVDAEGGAAAMRFRVPDGVAARIRSSIALGSSDVDPVRFPRNAEGSAWESPDFATAANRIEIEVRGGIGSVSVH
ncbi:MAG: hypothetical protein V2B17_00115 [Chloroflexota bacterium]